MQHGFLRSYRLASVQDMEVSLQNFAFEDPRSEDEINAEATLQKQIVKAYKAAKARKKAAKARMKEKVNKGINDVPERF